MRRVTFIQRFGDAKNLSPHFRMLATDGVYAEDDKGCIIFHPVPPPGDQEVERVAARFAPRIEKLMIRRGLASQGDQSEIDMLRDAQPLLAELYGASTSGRIATGPRAGRRVSRVGNDPDFEETKAVPGAISQKIESHPSETPITVCYLRALAAQDERAEIKRPDTYARLFLSDEWTKPLAESSFGETEMARFISHTLYGYFIARTAFMDRAFKEAFGNRIPQIVFLGAGYDSRRYRFRDQPAETRVFELDAPATQNRKREILLRQSVPMPPHLSFIPIIFNTDDLNEALVRSGFSRNQKSLFIWEGVTYYHGEAEVDRVLGVLENNCLPGSRLCFDHVTEKLQSSNAGEQMRFWIDKAKIPAYLASHGFSILDHADTEEMTRCYLLLQEGTPVEKPPSRMHFILAERQ
jgi:methyltransferase (TIGR00027 family)